VSSGPFRSATARRSASALNPRLTNPRPVGREVARSVRLLAPLAEDFAAWQRATSRGAPTDLVFPSPDASPWHADRARNWRKRAFADAAAAAGVVAARPYDRPP
jgi:hypothetical protein